MQKEQSEDKVQNCAEVQGNFKVCFSKHSDNPEKFFCVEDVKEILVQGKVRR